MQSVKIDRFLRLGIGVLAVVLVYVLYAAIHQRVVEAGDTAPDFTITADNGRTVSLGNFGGKVLLLNFWASWCQPCEEETPSLNKLAQDYASKGVVVLGISVDEDQAAYDNFLKTYNVSFPTSRDTSRKTAADYGTTMFPDTYVIDRSGHIDRKIVGGQDWTSPEMSQYFDSLLKQK